MKFKKILIGIVSLLTISNAMFYAIPSSADDYDIEFSISASTDSISEDGSSITISFCLDKNDTDRAGEMGGYKASIMGDTDKFSVTEGIINYTQSISTNSVEGSFESLGEVCPLEITMNSDTNGIVSIYLEFSLVEYNVIVDGSIDGTESYLEQTKPTTNILYFNVVDGKIVDVSDEPIEPEDSSTTTTPLIEPEVPEDSSTTTTTLIEPEVPEDSSTTTTPTSTTSGSDTDSSTTTISSSSTTTTTASSDGSSPSTSDAGLGVSIAALLTASIAGVLFLNKKNN